MRDIKFRMWGGDDSKNMFISEECTACLMQQIDFNAGIKTGYDHCGLHNSVFMQYTGLKDKNGKDIYEGDILKFMDKITCYVVWKNIGGWSYQWIDPTYIRVRQMNPEPFFHNISLNEIVGNIYQNPELL